MAVALSITSTTQPAVIHESANIYLRQRKTLYQLPSFHIKAPWGWMNDPCAPGYDPQTGQYHLFYQWNPKGCEWGNMSWGHLISSDLLTWTRNGSSPVLRPDEPYDKEGVFTGCFYPSGSHGESGQLTLFYSSVCNLPFHWSIPYPRGSVGLALATSKNGGLSWTKSAENPILAEEPGDLRVTGFRDPFIAKWEVLDELRGTESLYGIISGGIQGQGPACFFYAVQPQSLVKWDYLGPLLQVPRNFRPSTKWSGDHGINWECTNFMTLKSGTVSRHIIITGAESDVERDHVKQHHLPPTVSPRTIRWPLWISCRPVKTQNTISFEYNSGGILDHGSFYAANSFHDLVNKRQVLYGWIPEDDIPLNRAHAKGWNGCLALPREVYLLAIPDVLGALHTPLSDITSIDLTREANGTTTIHTLGIRPLPELVHLRPSSSQHSLSNIVLPSRTSNKHTWSALSSIWELEATIRIADTGCSRVGFIVRHTPDFAVRTTISFSPIEERIIVDRTLSTSTVDVNKCPEQGPHTLFRTKQGMEKLKLRVYCDGDILEVYANDRFALATMVYTDSATAMRLSCFAEGEDNCAVFENVDLWEGLRKVVIED